MKTRTLAIGAGLGLYGLVMLNSNRVEPYIEEQKSDSGNPTAIYHQSYLEIFGHSLFEPDKNRIELVKHTVEDGDKVWNLYRSLQREKGLLKDSKTISDLESSIYKKINSNYKDPFSIRPGDEIIIPIDLGKL